MYVIVIMGGFDFEKFLFHHYFQPLTFLSYLCLKLYLNDKLTPVMYLKFKFF